MITHNKLTMEVAATLYGVTMEERGISKLVSVELDDVQPERAQRQLVAPDQAEAEEAEAMVN